MKLTESQEEALAAFLVNGKVRFGSQAEPTTDEEKADERRIYNIGLEELRKLKDRMKETKTP